MCLGDICSPWRGLKSLEGNKRTKAGEEMANASLRSKYVNGQGILFSVEKHNASEK